MRNKISKDSVSNGRPRRKNPIILLKECQFAEQLLKNIIFKALETTRHIQ